MSDERRFGKCDECGAIGALVAVNSAGRVKSAHFCVSCQRIFDVYPGLSSFIAFQHSKAPGDLIGRIDIPLSRGPGRGENPGIGSGTAVLRKGHGEHRNLHGIQGCETRRRDDE